MQGARQGSRSRPHATLIAARMLAMFRLTFPFFALILAGYVVVVRRVLTTDAVRALNTFVLYVALPCMLFKFSAGLDLATLVSQPFIPIYGAVGLTLFSLLLAWGRWRGIRWKDMSFAALIGVFPNTGFMGVPLLVSMMGARAATPAVAIVLFDMIDRPGDGIEDECMRRLAGALGGCGDAGLQLVIDTDGGGGH